MSLDRVMSALEAYVSERVSQATNPPYGFERSLHYAIRNNAKTLTRRRRELKDALEAWKAADT